MIFLLIWGKNLLRIYRFWNEDDIFMKSILYVESNEMVFKYLNFDKWVKYMI